ncbi:MAG TPA: hypothetical protein VNP92_21775 [Actinophytocola sp.]|nr:hypothetical protein [Actinophytocola sp.]
MSDPERGTFDPNYRSLPGRFQRFDLEGDEIESDGLQRPLRRPPLTSVTGSAELRTPQTNVPLAPGTPQLAAVTTSRATTPPRTTDAWASHLNLLLSVESQVAVDNGTLTAAEAELLLARLAIVIDQALTAAQP